MIRTLSFLQLFSWAALPAQPALKLVELDATFDQPVDMSKAQDGTDDIYITERLGKVYRYSRGDEKVRLWIGDIGEFNYQEMNHQPAGNRGGQNYGWSCVEGLEPYPIRDPSCEKAKFYDAPRFAYPTTSDDGINGKFITGGYVYRGPEKALNG